MDFENPTYPPELLDLHSGRELARLSQTDVTADPLARVKYGLAAHEIGHQEMDDDTTLASEAAAKVGIGFAQLNAPVSVVDRWFDEAHSDLPVTPAGEREEVAIYLLLGRALGLMALHAGDSPESHNLFIRATAAFNSAQAAATEQHTPGKAWDPYATMLARHHATAEAVKPGGKAGRAAQIALTGISRALRSRFETANTPDVSPLKKIPTHIKFVGKQVLMNTVALSLALSQPFDRSSKIKQARQSIAEQLLS